MGPYGPIRALWAHMGPNPDYGPQPGPLFELLHTKPCRIIEKLHQKISYFIKIIDSLSKTDDFIKPIDSLSKTNDFIKPMDSLSKTDDVDRFSQ